MSNETRYAVRALLKFAQENQELQVKCARYEAEKRAFAVAMRLAENGAIEHNQVMEKAASLAKEDLNVVEKALDLNLSNVLSIGSAAMAKEAEAQTGKREAGRNLFEDFLVSNFS
jgi:hypothetical protein